MPCTVDLFPVYSYYDKYDRANYLFFKTPLVPLLCESLRLIEQNSLTEELPTYIREMILLWKEEHAKCDRSREYLNYYRLKEKVLDRFIELETVLSKV